MRRQASFRSRKWGRKKLVVLEKLGGNEDVQNAYYKHPAAYPVLFFPRSVVKVSAHFFLGSKLTDANYFSETIGLEEAKKAYRDHLVGVLGWFKVLFGLSAFLQFNLAYYAEQELARACNEADVTFVCLQKEALWSPFEMDFLGQSY